MIRAEGDWSDGILSLVTNISSKRDSEVLEDYFLISLSKFKFCYPYMYFNEKQINK